MFNLKRKRVLLTEYDWFYLIVLILLKGLVDLGKSFALWLCDADDDGVLV